MALPFYNQGDQDIYAGGDHFVPQEQYRLNYTPSQSLASTIGNTGGVTGAQAANPYIYPQGGEGGGGGFSNTNKYGLDLDTQKTVRVGMANAEGVYEPTPIEIAKSPGGIWKNKKTGQNVYHGNIGFKGMIGTVMDKVMGKKSIPGVPDEGSTTGAEWDEEFDPTITGKKLNTYQRWKAKKEFVAQQEKAAADQAAADQVRQNIQTYKITGRGGQGGNRPDTGINTPGGGKGQSPTGGNVEGTPFAQGGRIGLRPGGIVDAGKQYYGKEDWEIQQINKYGVSYPEFLQNQYGKGLHEMDIGEIATAVKAWDSWRSSQAQGGLIGYFDGGIARLL